MKLKYLLRFVLVLFVTLWGATAGYADNFTADEAQAWTDGKGKEILEIMTSENSAGKFQKLDSLLLNDVDLDYAARFVVGKYWRKMTPEQQQQYIPLFKRYTSALYKGYPLDLDKGSVTYTIDKVITDKDSQFVHCTIFVKTLENTVDDESKGGVKVVFRLVKNNGKIQVRDLQIMESGFLHAYRERFYKMIYEDNDEDMDWFLEDLQQLTDDMEKQLAENAEDEDM